MRLAHLRTRRRLSLLAFHALEGREHQETLAHVEGCPGCQEELLELRAVLDRMKADPVHAADPDLPVQVLVARVQARVEQTLAGRRARFAWRLLALPVTAAVIAALSIILLPRVLPKPEESSAPRAALESPALETAMVSGAALERLERNLAREQAARYLNEAQDVLVTVAASPRKCDPRVRRLDVAEETRRSRELLARRALMVEMDSADVVSVRPVLEDVEFVLREVASLQACARPQDLEAITQEISRRRLLMKIDLMTRELQG